MSTGTTPSATSSMSLPAGPMLALSSNERASLLSQESSCNSVAPPIVAASLTVLDREDFIATKLFAGGPQDLADAAAAVSVDRATLDVALLETLARAFGPETAERLRHLLAAD